MTLTDLRYIVALHQTGHFGRAAELCGISQPTLSIAVKRLEESLGVLLFERSRTGVQATPIGVAILDQARRVLAEAARIVALAHRGRDPLGSQLAVVATHIRVPVRCPC